MSEWQPIETAPKDGTYIIGWSGDGKCARMYVQWSEKRKDFDVHGFSGLSRGYTHWMPLPPPPTK